MRPDTSKSSGGWRRISQARRARRCRCQASAFATLSLLVAQQHRYHPVREFLSRLEWDGVSRIASVLEEILGVEPTELSQAMMRAWFISAVARPMKPGCKVDHVLILVGPQSLGKSQFFVELAGPKWFSDSVIDIQNRDFYLLLRRVWILEWSELESMQRARHQDAAKAFITSAVDVYRAPYARATESVPRTSIIVGTTNDPSFLSDPTGNRRYWPIAVKRELNLTRLAEWRDQLWAEAVVAFKKGEKWWLTSTMEGRLSEQQEDFEQVDPWTEPILTAAAGHSSRHENGDAVSYHPDRSAFASVSARARIQLR
jgi:putative DNA primase/helicase